MVTVMPMVSVFAEVDRGLLAARPLADAELGFTTVSLIHRMGRQLEGGAARMLAILETKLKSWSS